MLPIGTSVYPEASCADDDQSVAWRVFFTHLTSGAVAAGFPRSAGITSGAAARTGGSSSLTGGSMENGPTCSSGRGSAWASRGIGFAAGDVVVLVVGACTCWKQPARALVVAMMVSGIRTRWRERPKPFVA